MNLFGVRYESACLLPTPYLLASNSLFVCFSDAVIAGSDPRFPKQEADCCHLLLSEHFRSSFGQSACRAERGAKYNRTIIEV